MAITARTESPGAVELEACTELRNALSVDVEDYFQVSAFASTIARGSWDEWPARIERNMDVLLGLFAEHGIRVTFFTLGWIAERYPQLVRRIVAGGHELASHGYDHQRVTGLDAESFRQDLARAKGILEDCGGVRVIGYRAPSFSIDEHTPWALDCLIETDHRYSSSLYPIAHDHYGSPQAPRWPFQPRPSSEFLELPVATLRFVGRNWPVAGGGYFRLFPYGISQWSLRRINRCDRRPFIFYLHPWEIDPQQPRLPKIGMKTRFRHYLNLHRMQPRLQRLLLDFHWDRIDRIFLES
ncbi:MAG TPA: XrtA system polysaccharide deacetylase [Nitrococcus sp.]|nr:XrtA system polysaccharide deacetylase [Nitrococcus sp.]